LELSLYSLSHILAHLENSWSIGERMKKEGHERKGKKRSSKEELKLAPTMTLLVGIKLHL